MSVNTGGAFILDLGPTGVAPGTSEQDAAERRWKCEHGYRFRMDWWTFPLRDRGCTEWARDVLCELSKAESQQN